MLVLAPHPDDETMGCGGSLALHAKAGDPVKIVFLTNGAKGDTSGKMDKKVYVELRQQESTKACDRLGVQDLEFWGYEDRALAGSRGALVRLVDLLKDFEPDLVYVPSPFEVHPDHRAACFLFCDAVRSYDPNFQVAFYEIGQPLSVNVFVDVTGVIDLKQEAISVYKSQLKERQYDAVMMALSRYRSFTLPEGVTHAEGFSQWQADIVRKVGPFGIPFLKIEKLSAESGEAGPLVSIIVRTKDRPKLLVNALRSIVEQTYANLEIVVVNDGGEDVRDVVTGLSGGVPVIYTAHEKSMGRAAAANTGIKVAKGSYLNFLDDDDVFYPDHVETMVRSILPRDEKVVYASVSSAYFNGSPENLENCIKRVVNHNIDFDPDRILFQNYIPILSALFHKDVITKVGGFSQDLNLFEDWEFWIRASRHFKFYHVDKITAEYRFYGADITEASHHQNYDYCRAQAKIFDRVIPFLTGKIWVKLLRSNFLDSLRNKERNNDEQFNSILSYLKERDGVLERYQERFGKFKALLNTEQNRLARMNMKLDEAIHKSNIAHEVIEKLRSENETNKALLQEIFLSKGWRWLSRYRALKLKLNFDRANKGQ